MAHFAKLNENNIVLEVLVVKNEVILDENNNENEQKGIDFLKNITGHEKWKQTSYNHNFRNCYAGTGYLYDDQNDRFIEPKPFNSWVLVNELVNNNKDGVIEALLIFHQLLLMEMKFHIKLCGTKKIYVG